MGHKLSIASVLVGVLAVMLAQSPLPAGATTPTPLPKPTGTATSAACTQTVSGQVQAFDPFATGAAPGLAGTTVTLTRDADGTVVGSAPTMSTGLYTIVLTAAQSGKFTIDASHSGYQASRYTLNSIGTCGASEDLMLLPICTGNELWAWGYNGYGQLGDGTTTDRPTPVLVSNLRGMTAIAADGNHSLAIDCNGQGWAWGDNSDGDLGDGSVGQQRAPVSVVGLSPIVNGVATATAGRRGNHSLALQRHYYPYYVGGGGTVANLATAWGEGDHGELGNQSTANSPAPVTVLGPGDAPLAGVTAIASGGNHNLALKSDGTVWAWGDNKDGDLGDGTTIQRDTAVQAVGLSGIKAIAAGGYFSLALDAQGALWAWGDNSFGQLGDGSNTSSSIPVAVGNQTQFTSIAAGGSALDGGHVLALDTDGDIWAWGDNVSGELGDGTTTNRTTPERITDQFGLRGRFTAIAAGEFFSLALDTRGRVWTWGHNANGQLGHSSNGSCAMYGTQYPCSLRPAPIAGLSGISAIAAGDAFSRALTGPVGGVTRGGDEESCTQDANTQIYPICQLLDDTTPSDLSPDEPAAK